MAARGQEAIGSMGNDAALAVLSNKPQFFFAYFKQLFAQVTNPPIDPLREELVMSLENFVGVETNILAEAPEFYRGLKLYHPILMPGDMINIRNATHQNIITRDVDMLFPATGDENALKIALDAIFKQADESIAHGATMLVLTDRNVDRDHIPIPSLLALSGLHHYLNNKGLRTAVGIIVETGEAREVMHFALLVAFGADAICPYLAFSTVHDMAESGYLGLEITPEEAMDNYIVATKKGFLKTLSRMGISTLHSFFGAPNFEAIGVGSDVIRDYFPDTISRVSGIGMQEIATEATARHLRAFPAKGKSSNLLDVGGAYQVRKDGEKHLWYRRRFINFNWQPVPTTIAFLKNIPVRLMNNLNQKPRFAVCFALKKPNPSQSKKSKRLKIL
jgi:hypothetical protein